ncbi:ABC transporter ATP-binding protein [Neptunomonas phycophila]|uniref:ABC transporter ATP-binding protein n=1 Tax=Neptunomonas phycophila TaxID=1572645 RepID=UPI000948D6A5|nr:ABC transporter ATP-binding protein [Neptunomonas phycophila]
METSNVENGQALQPRPIRRIISPICGSLTLAVALAAVGTMLTLSPFFGMLHSAEQLLQSREMLPLATNEIEYSIVLSLAALFIGMILVSVGELVAHLADNRLTHHLRLATVKHLSRVPLGWFTQRSCGEIKQVLQDDISTLHSLTAHFFTSVARALAAVSVSLIFLLVQDWRMALITFIPFVAFVLFLKHAMTSGEANMPELMAGLTQINRSAVEFIRGMTIIKTFNTNGRTAHGYHDAVDYFASAFARFTQPLVSIMANAHALIAPVTVLGFVLAVGVLFIALGWMTPLELLPFIIVAPGMCAPLLLLHTLLHDLGSAAGAAQRVLAIMDTPTLEPTNLAPRQPDGHTLEFRQVSYAYEAERQVLSDISFTAKPGTITAIVGPSGAGKSTLARLLLRFFDPTQGNITLGGVDLRQIDPSDLYRHIGFVLQEVHLIRASIRDNIALGKPSASQEEIENAAKAANIHERILTLTHGYDTVIGEETELSGGERQRLSIARAVLIDPPILILDEATASADIDNEVLIQNAIARFAAGRTVIVIAHQLDTIMHADHILVMQEGTIVEQGVHQKLVHQNGLYSQLWSLGGYTAHASDVEASVC